MNNSLIKNEAVDEFGELLNDCIEGVLSPHKIPFTIKKIKGSVLFFKDYLYWSKVEKFLKGFELSLRETVNVSNRLFVDSKNAYNNCKRIMELIDKIDVDNKVKFLINATRSCFLQKIDETMYFRFVKTIIDVLYEDLLFIKENIMNPNDKIGNIQVLMLHNNGLMHNTCIDELNPLEKQKYCFSKYAYDLDRYVLSFGDEERENWHKTNLYVDKYKSINSSLIPMSDEDVNAIFNKGE